MISFAPNLTQKYNSLREKIFITIIQSWCDGNKITIFHTSQNEENYEKIDSNLNDDIAVFVEKNHKNHLNGGYISQVNEQFFFSNTKTILTRCGCGKSFSFKSGNDAKDKIALLRKKLQKNRTVHEK